MASTLWGLNDKTLFFFFKLNMKNSHVVVTHGLDGVHDLRDLVVDHTVQLPISNSVTVHNDA